MRKQNSAQRTRWMLAAATAGVLGLSMSAQAATHTWNGGGSDANWSTVANWSAIPVASNATFILFDGTAPNLQLTTGNMDIAALNTTGIAKVTMAAGEASPVIVGGSSLLFQQNDTFAGVDMTLAVADLTLPGVVKNAFGNAFLLVAPGRTLTLGTLGGTSGQGWFMNQVAMTGSVVVTGAVTGTIPIQIQAPMTMTLSGDSPAGTNTFNIGNGNTASIVNLTGSLTGAGGTMNVNKLGVFNIDDTGAVNNVDRVATGRTINLNGGTVNYKGGNVAASSETLGTVALLAGENTIGITATNNAAALTITTLSRAAGSAGTIKFINVTGGSAGLTISAGPTSANGIANTYLTASDGASSNWVGLSGTTASPYTAYTALAVAGAADNALASVGANDTVSASQTINTLKAAPTGAGFSTTIDPSQTLTVGTGGVLYDGGGNNYTIGGTGKLVLATSEPIIWVKSDMLTIDAPLSDSLATAGLTKVGAGTLRLTNPNTFGGPLSVLSGDFQTTDNDLSVGSLLGQPGNIGLGAGNLTFGTDNTTASVQFFGGTNGTGKFIKVGTGQQNVTMNNLVSFAHGSTDVTGGTLKFLKTDTSSTTQNIGTGTFTLSNGATLWLQPQVLNATWTFQNAINVAASGGVLDVTGNGLQNSHLNIQGNITLNGGEFTYLHHAPTTNFDGQNVQGAGVTTLTADSRLYVESYTSKNSITWSQSIQSDVAATPRALTLAFGSVPSNYISGQDRLNQPLIISGGATTTDVSFVTAQPAQLMSGLVSFTTPTSMGNNVDVKAGTIIGIAATTQLVKIKPGSTGSVALNASGATSWSVDLNNIDTVGGTADVRLTATLNSNNTLAALTPFGGATGTTYKFGGGSQSTSANDPTGTLIITAPLVNDPGVDLVPGNGDDVVRSVDVSAGGFIHSTPIMRFNGTTTAAANTYTGGTAINDNQIISTQSASDAVGITPFGTGTIAIQSGQVRFTHDGANNMSLANIPAITASHLGLVQLNRTTTGGFTVTVTTAGLGRAASSKGIVEIVDPITGGTLGVNSKLFNSAAAVTAATVIVAPTTVILGDAANAGNLAYATYSANGYVTATATALNAFDAGVAGAFSEITAATDIAGGAVANAVRLNGGGITNTVPGTLTVRSGGILLANNSQTIAAPVTFDNAGAVEALIGTRSGLTLTLNNTVTAGAGITKFGLGTLALGNINVAGPSAISGPITIQEGAITIPATTDTASAVLPDVVANFNGALSIARNTTIGALSGTGTVASSAAAVLSLNQATDSTFYGRFTGNTLSLNKTGVGKLTLANGRAAAAGFSDFAGTTTVTAGTLELMGNTSVGYGNAARPSTSNARPFFGELGAANTAVTVGDALGVTAASLLVNGAYFFNRPITIPAGATAGATIGGNSADTTTWGGVVTANSSVNVTAAAGGTATFTNDFVLVGGVDVTEVGAGTVNVGGFSGAGGNIDQSVGLLNFSVDSNKSLTANRVRANNVTLKPNSNTTLNEHVAGPQDPTASKVATLTMFPNAILDIKNNAVVINTGTLAVIRPLIVSNAIKTTSVQTPVAGKVTAVGYAIGTDAAIAGLGGSLAGQSFGAGSVLLKYTFVGDSNLDGSVDGSDVALWAQNFTGALGPNPANPRNWVQGDWNYDGSVDGADVALWATNFTGALGGGGLGGVENMAAAPAGGLGITVEVPEPTSLALLGIGALGLLSRRNRRE